MKHLRKMLDDLRRTLETMVVSARHFLTHQSRGHDLRQEVKGIHIAVA